MRKYRQFKAEGRTQLDGYAEQFQVITEMFSPEDGSKVPQATYQGSLASLEIQINECRELIADLEAIKADAANLSTEEEYKAEFAAAQEEAREILKARKKAEKNANG